MHTQCIYLSACSFTENTAAGPRKHKRKQIVTAASHLMTPCYYDSNSPPSSIGYYGY